MAREKGLNMEDPEIVSFRCSEVWEKVICYMISNLFSKMTANGPKHSANVPPGASSSSCW
jgi:hypothetical protein